MILSKKQRKVMTIIVAIASIALIVGSLASSLSYLFK